MQPLQPLSQQSPLLWLLTNSRFYAATTLKFDCSARSVVLWLFRFEVMCHVIRQCIVGTCMISHLVEAVAMPGHSAAVATSRTVEASTDLRSYQPESPSWPCVLQQHSFLAGLTG